MAPPMRSRGAVNGVHLNSRGGMIVAHLIQEFVGDQSERVSDAIAEQQGPDGVRRR